MKNIFFIALFICSALTTILAQKIPSKAVIDAFENKFPHATKVKWDKENEIEYEAEFIINDVEYSANFTEEGIWLETEKEINYDALPESVKKSFRATYKIEKVKEVAEIETAIGMVKYEIEFKKGLKTIEVLYPKEGKLIE